MYKVRDHNHRRLELIVRTVMNILVFYFVVAGNMVAAGIVTVLFAALFLYDYALSKKQGAIVLGLVIGKRSKQYAGILSCRQYV